YTIDSRWRNRAEFIQGRTEIEAFLTRKWNRELDYRLIKEVWTFREDRIAVRFAYEWHDDSGNWFRSNGNENWEFDEHGLMRLRIASINDLPIKESERKYHWPLGRRPDSRRSPIVKRPRTLECNCYVCFGSKAEILECPIDVRFTPKSRHWDSAVKCPLCARSGHLQRTRSCPLWVTADIAASATHRKAKLILPIIQIATAATSPALTNTPDTTAALNRITPNAYAI